MQPSIAVQPTHKMMGVTLVLVAAILWGVSGTVAQFMFQVKGFNAGWLVVIRLLFAGLLMLMVTYPKQKHKVWKIWRSKQERIHLVLFGLLGMLGVQYTYFAAIEASNAATATILQYLGPVVILFYLVIRARRSPTYKELIVIILALIGTFLLVTDGTVHSLTLSKGGLFWGLASAIALAFYTLHPASLIKKWGTMVVVGWGMLIGGIGFSFIFHPWDIQGTWDSSSIFALLFIIVFGTLIPFYCYLESMNYISPSETSTLACAEPLSAAVVSIIWLHVSFGWVQWIGTIFILATIMLISRWRNQ
ncbi:drug/metabolite transporter (DMT)-like permease [Bacillus mesophilus]|uniref:EamA family transporter n=1 Tax=Bacillus mesophilus TaxID=1808955 RepID=A0A6M0Q5I2_9BACI|nr:EamA family transporter [Bacillus mesophilus]MBM7660932.1 drug/metabolite transporter (DMT)-like permease [Bacillus mesophilus]NEY71524.1 EamA family transporter [Bacillus mesophilus]